MKKLQGLLEDYYDDFKSLENVEKSSYVLVSELWESKFDELLSLVKEHNYCNCVGNKKTKLIIIIIIIMIVTHAGFSLQLHSQSSPGERNGKFGQNGMLKLK